MNYKVSKKKADGKWWTWGRIKTNQFGNLQLSFKVTDEFKALVNDGSEWLNFSLFDDDEKKVATQKDTDKALDDFRAKIKSEVDQDEVPF